MEHEKKKIVIPRELQIKMLNFFLKTSIPRKKKELNESTIKNK